MNIGFLGIGNMGGSILKGFLANNINSKDIFIYDIDILKLEQFKQQFNVNICTDYEELVKNVDCLILAVKPDIILKVLENIKGYLDIYNPIIVSIAAGVSTSSLCNTINNDNIGIIRIMPNINAEIGLATSAYCYNNIKEENVEYVINLFKTIGSVFYIPEEKFSIFTAIAGCSPAYIYLFLDSIAKGAQKMGLNKKEALQIAIDVTIGSANMLKISEKHPWELIDKVCSPGGTTIEGICTLEENNFQQGIVKAIENTIKKDISLNK
ncbi:pyrroline-5-carboxylate reductase [uncultured Tyzzerella sp.]|uniref:pyrroline-5-carboxylate reductase n=1 Tax=uncultured Tyzzerella sp. TaxID=2321398 RepID=UPI002941FD32|nr:pyrroline-5-carboxylate reductase [uncultured Tyzzerella sp.]